VMRLAGCSAMRARMSSHEEVPANCMMPMSVRASQPSYVVTADKWRLGRLLCGAYVPSWKVAGPPSQPQRASVRRHTHPHEQHRQPSHSDSRIDLRFGCVLLPGRHGAHRCRAWLCRARRRSEIGSQRLDDAALALQGMPKPYRDAQNATYQMLLRMGFDVETARAGAVNPQVLQAALNGQIPKRCAARN
jgi:hypothetical protein